MLKNYFKIAWRNLGKNKKSSFINIGGLAIGMAVAMLIGLWIWDELSFDKYHKSYPSAAQLMQHQTINGQAYTGSAIPFPLGDEIRSNYGSDFKYIAMASWEGSHILTVGEKKISQSGIYIDKDGPKLLALEMISGTADGLKEPGSILLSATAAKTFFGEGEAVNQLMKIDNKLDVKVTGVYKDLPKNTRFKDLHFLAPWDLYVSSEPWINNSRTNWGNNSFQLFAQINENADFATVNKKIKDVKLNRLEESEKRFKAAIFLHPMKDWHLHTGWKNGIQTGGLIGYVWLFSIIGLFVLLLACINFMNLSTARSERRAKEVGIRKTVGSLRSQLIAQFLSESILVAFLAFIFSLLLVQLILPGFNSISNKEMTILWGNGWFWIAGIGFTLLTGLIAGSYPALYLSSFKPIKVLKGTFKAGRFAAIPRKVLVVVQFTVSVALIIGTVIVYRQIQYSKNRPVGYDRDGMMMIEMKSPDFYGKFDILRAELKKQGAIVEMAESSSPLTGVWSNNSGFHWEGKDPNQDTDFGTIWVTHEFGKTVNWQFKEGRDFSRDFMTDSASIVLNEASVKFMGIKDPVGKTIRWGNGEGARTYTVIGVIKDMVMQSPYTPVKQSIYLLNNDNANWMNLKLNPEKSASSSIAIIEKVFKTVIPSAPFEYKFADLEYASKFDAEERVGKLATFFTLLAILISCLGLFGLASFVAEQRTKEIGIRKIVGASVFNLWGLLSKEFIILVSISCLIAMPVAYYYLHGWLQQYEYRTTISWWVFAAATAGALLITLLTVSFQAIKAALANPVKSLRTE